MGQTLQIRDKIFSDKENKKYQERTGMKEVGTRVYRQELKFLCEERQLRVIEDRIRHICRPDAHGGNKGIYTVRSLYFDTYDDKCYQENLAGVDRRKKYRIRAYNEDTDRLRLECKSSCHGRKSKEGCPVDRELCRKLAAGQGRWGVFPEGRLEQGREDPGAVGLLERFLLERRLELLEPRVVVEYDRTPYVYPVGNVRITFGISFRTSHQVFAFPEKSRVRRLILPEGVNVLEVKYDEVLPGAVRELLTAGQELRRTSFSKYALCRQYGFR